MKEKVSDPTAAMPWWRKFAPPRHLAMLGGTVTFRDCLAVLPFLLNPKHLVRGDAIAEYEAAFARTVGVRHAVTFSSARVGFYGLLRTLGVGLGDQVLLQVPTHVVVSNAIRYSGAEPVYVDCDPENYNMDFADAERKVTPRTKVLLLQHTFGIPADIDSAVALARRHGLVLIEDCVHALGATYKGKMVGCFGRAAFYSTEETKIISTTMGGVVATDDAELAAGMRSFQQECAPPDRWLAARYIVKLFMYCVLAHPYLHYYTRMVYEFFGKRLPLPRPTSHEELLGLKPLKYEQRLSNAQAVMGLRQLRKLEENVAHRRMIAHIYADGLRQLGFKVPRLPKNAQASLVRFPVQVPDRDAFSRLAAPHFVPGAWFASVLEEAVSPECGGYVPGACPWAELVARHLVNLPTHPRVTADDARRLVSVVGLYCRERIPERFQYGGGEIVEDFAMEKAVIGAGKRAVGGASAARPGGIGS